MPAPASSSHPRLRDPPPPGISPPRRPAQPTCLVSSAASPWARRALKVLFPTPPFPESTRIVCFTERSRSRSSAASAAGRHAAGQPRTDRAPAPPRASPQGLPHPDPVRRRRRRRASGWGIPGRRRPCPPRRCWSPGSLQRTTTDGLPAHRHPVRPASPPGPAAALTLRPRPARRLRHGARRCATSAARDGGGAWRGRPVRTRRRSPLPPGGGVPGGCAPSLQRGRPALGEQPPRQTAYGTIDWSGL